MFDKTKEINIEDIPPSNKEEIYFERTNMSDWKQTVIESEWSALPLIITGTALEYARVVEKANPLYKSPKLFSASNRDGKTILVYQIGSAARFIEQSGDRMGMTRFLIGYVTCDVDTEHCEYGQVESASEFGCYQKILDTTGTSKVTVCESILSWIDLLTKKTFYTNGWNPNDKLPTYACSCDGRVESLHPNTQSVVINCISPPEKINDL